MFQNISLYEFANEFEKIGGKTLLIDEIHKLSNWSNQDQNYHRPNITKTYNNWLIYARA